MSAAHQDIEHCLSTSKVGNRYWFWFCPELSVDQPRLILSGLSSDPGFQKIPSILQSLKLPIGSFQCTGIATVGESGRMHFASPFASPVLQLALVEWVAEHVESVPSLSRLHGAGFVAIDDVGRVLDRYDDITPWETIPSSWPPGSVGSSVEELHALQGEAWFWMTAHGPSGRPFLLLSDRNRDAEGTQFQADRSAALQRTDELKSEVSGVVRRMAGDRLVWVVDGAAKHWQSTISALLESYESTLPQIGILRASYMARLRKGKIVDTSSWVPEPEPDGPSYQAALLAGLTRAEPLYFWFTKQSRDGKAQLLLERNLPDLKERVTRRVGDGEAIHGRLHATEKQWLEFRSHSEMKDFLPELARWVSPLLAAHPDMGGLIGSRITIRDSQGQIMSRHKDAASWKQVQTLSAQGARHAN